MQHESWIDAGEALGWDDLKGVKMPGGKAKDLSHTFPRPSVKVEDIWNEVCSALPMTRTFLTGISISSTMFLRFVFAISCSAALLDRNIYPRAAMPANLFLSLLSQVRNFDNQAANTFHF